MTLAIRNSRATVAPDPSLVAAGADIPEADTAQAVAADPSVIDAERHPLYSDGVQHSTNLKSEGDRDQLGCESVLHSSYSRSVRASADAGSEAADALRITLAPYSRAKARREAVCFALRRRQVRLALCLLACPSRLDARFIDPRARGSFLSPGAAAVRLSRWQEQR